MVRNISAHGGQAEASSRRIRRRKSRTLLDDVNGMQTRLADSYQQLEQALVQRERLNIELRALTEDLDRKVRERTAELAAAKRAAEEANQREERVPREHEPRDPHADERHHRHDRAGARHAADARAARVPDDGEELGRRAAGASSTTSSTSRRSRAASSSSRRFRSRSRDQLADLLKPLALRAEQKGLELVAPRAPDVPSVARRRSRPPAPGAGQPRRQRDQVHRARRDRGAGRGRVAHRRRRPCCTSSSATPASASRRTSSARSSSRSSRPTARRRAGSAAPGSGLTISSTLVELMGGRIWVESEPDEGSTFHFTVAPGPHRGAARSRPRVNLADLPVLVVDDNAVNRRILHDLLLRWQMRPTVVESGAAALRALRRAPASEAARSRWSCSTRTCRRWTASRWRGGSATKRSWAADDHDAQLVGPVRRDRGSAASSGIATHLTKPVEQRELLDAIARVARAASPASAPTLPAAMLPADLPERRLHVLLAEDNAVNQRLAASLLERRGHKVDVAGNGREAVEALAARSRSTWS